MLTRQEMLETFRFREDIYTGEGRYNGTRRLFMYREKRGRGSPVFKNHIAKAWKTYAFHRDWFL
jgi:hypothetical protein